MNKNKKTSILILSHGSPREDANRVFSEFVGRVASRLPASVMVEPVFFSLTRPTLMERVAEMDAAGVSRLLMLPYFLHNGQHVLQDIPELIEQCRAVYPRMEIEQLSTLQGDPMLEYLVVERLRARCDMEMDALEIEMDPSRIEKQSHKFIEERAAIAENDPHARAIVRRVIHATADFSFADTMRITPHAVERGREAIKAGRPVICDVNMLAAGITRTPGETLCAIGDQEVARRASNSNTTRAAQAMEKLKSELEGAVVAVGNAPTALWKLMDIAETGGPCPALVVGMPVGFVGASESKEALWESGLCCITNRGNRGGSAAAAAAVNAICCLL